MTDNHVHIGWYSDGYHYPLDIWKAEQDAGIDDIVVSSTSTCAELYKLVVSEMNELIKVGGSHIHPLLWVTPRMMKSWGIRYMLHSKIRWQGLKMHWGAHREWYYNKKLVNLTLKIAQKRNIPVLFHTGGSKECEPKVFENIIRQYADLKFVLAHGRPLDQTIEVLGSCTNAYVDTAFMPIGDVSELIEKGFLERILFGSDVPVNMIYQKNDNITDYLKSCMLQLSSSISSEQYYTITNNQLYKSINYE